MGGGITALGDGLGQNWYGIGLINPCPALSCGNAYAYAENRLTPTDAFQIDSKMDDGMPNLADVQASQGSSAVV